jgi:hypothetical protein
LSTFRSWFITQALIVFLWRSMPIKFMVRSWCGNKTVSGHKRTDVYHVFKATGTRLRPPLHSFITVSIELRSLTASRNPSQAGPALALLKKTAMQSNKRSVFICMPLLGKMRLATSLRLTRWQQHHS